MNRLFIFILIILPYNLYAWGDKEIVKLNDGSCKINLQIGYKSSSLYIKNNEAFLIVDGGDSRYGTLSTVYNVKTCKKVTSGEKYKSNFNELMINKGFEETNLALHTNLIDKNFKNEIYFNIDGDEAIIHVVPINMDRINRIKRLLSNINNKNISSQINIPKSIEVFFKNKEFYSQFLKKIKDTPFQNINYKYALALNNKFNGYNIDKKIGKKILLEKEKREKRRIKEIFPKYISIPEELLVRTSSGCKALNPLPSKRDSIEWTGECVNGLIDGVGTLTWYKNGKQIDTEIGAYYRYGFPLKNRIEDKKSTKNYIIQSSKNKRCRFTLPSTIAFVKGESLKLMDVEFIGGCRRKKYQGQVNIFFNKKLFAKYKGKLSYRDIPSYEVPYKGKLEYFSGDIYESTSIEDWYYQLHLVHINKIDSGLNENDFNIKLKFSTNIADVQIEDNSIYTTKNDIILKYDVKPIYKEKLSKEQYNMILEIKMNLESDDGFNRGEKHVIYDYALIRLKKSNGYHAQGKLVLRKIKTYWSGPYSKNILSNFKPTAKVLSIYEKE